jgi:hypothetical protein
MKTLLEKDLSRLDDEPKWRFLGVTSTKDTVWTVHRREK